MRFHVLSVVSAAVLPLMLAAREEAAFDVDWRFHLGDAPGAEVVGFDDSSWRALDLPHDWSIEGPYDEHAPTGGSGGYLPAGIGWYRKAFRLPNSARGRRVEIRFDGVYERSTVWINGHELGTWPYGYTTFAYDLTDHVHTGDEPNVIAVRVDNSQQPNSRWYAGSGIYRHVWLTLADPLHLPTWGVHVTTPAVSTDNATVRIRTRVRNERATDEHVTLLSAVIATEVGAGVPGRAEAGALPVPTEQTALIPAGGEHEFDQAIEVRAPRLWSPDAPQLYVVASTVSAGGKVVDRTSARIGIRSIEYDVDRGFLLNGTRVKMKGMCVHHDGGAVGAAVPEAVLRRRLLLLKEMGCNAVRTSHNPMAPEFYDLCDEIGLLVMNEAFDEWTVRKPQIQHGYSDVFGGWWEQDLVNFIRRDRNHPSVVMWSAGNEIGEQWADEGPEILRKLVEVFHREDPTRPVTAAMDNIFNQGGQAPEAFSEKLDIVGYNYVDRWGTRRETHYADDRQAYPQRRFVGTENASARGVRGEYRFGPLVGRRSFFAPPDGEAAAAALVGALWTTDMLRAESLWRFVATHDYVIGDFAWTGFDYLGESWWPRKLAPSGPLDTCGFKKDAFYLYQSLWTDAPMVHVLPHWNWEGREGQVIPVVVYSNADIVELFLDGRSLGAKAREFPAQGAEGGWATYARPVLRATTSDLHLTWDVPFEPGEIRAIGYDRNGTETARDTVRTAGPAASLDLSVDCNTLEGDGRDVAHVTVRALDANGVFVPLADNLVRFDLIGSARIRGVDNGDPASHESYQGSERRLFNGMALVLVQVEAAATAGSVRLTARADGLPEASVEIAIRPAPPGAEGRVNY